MKDFLHTYPESPTLKKLVATDISNIQEHIVLGIPENAHVIMMNVIWGHLLK